MKSATSKFVFALIIGAYVVGRIYMLFVPTYTIENNLELNAGYYSSITESTTTEKSPAAGNGAGEAD
ncbi:MAG: hypothetical protein PF545_01460 [Elusimicrobia bacterium]|jgi:hypothetical protein|nr:hypothetical protein [Elusimicrobiota bacterium]